MDNDENKDNIDDKVDDIKDDTKGVVDIDKLIIDNKDNVDFISKIRSALGIDEELEQLRQLKEKIDGDDLLKDLSTNPKDVLDKVKSAQDAKWNKRVTQLEKELKEKNDKVESFIQERNNKTISDSINKSLKDFDVVDGAEKDILSNAISKFNIDSDGDIVNKDGQSVDDYLKDYLKDRPYLLNSKKGSGTYLDRQHKTKQNGTVKLNSRFKRG